MNNSVNVQMISIGSIEPSAMNSRKTVEDDSIKELAQSITANGLLQPIVVREAKKKGKYEIVCGERRWRACDIAGFKEIPAIVKELNYKQAYDAMVTENLQRKDIEPLEEAEAFFTLLKSGYSVEELAYKFGKSEKFIRLRLKLNDLISEWKDRLSKKDIGLGVALEVCKLDNEKQKELFEHFKNSEITTKQVVEQIGWKYTYRLGEAVFGMNDDVNGSKRCSMCSKNSACELSLFESAVDNALCLDKVCYKQKTKDWIIKKAVSGNAGMILTAYNMGDEDVKDIIKSLSALGIDVVYWYDKFEYCNSDNPEYPEAEDYEDEDEEYEKACREYEKDKVEFDERIAKGELVKAVVIGSYNGLCWIEEYGKVKEQCKTEGCLDGAKSKEDIEIITLQEQDNRNIKIRDENVIKQLRDDLNTKDYDLNTKALSQAEKIVVISMMMRGGTDSMREKLGINLRDFNDADMVELCRKITDEQQDMIIRGFIKQKVTDGNAGYNKSTQEALKLIMSDQFPDETKEITDKFDLVYQRRKERIVKRIEEIKA